LGKKRKQLRNEPGASPGTAKHSAHEKIKSTWVSFFRRRAAETRAGVLNAARKLRTRAFRLCRFAGLRFFRKARTVRRDARLVLKWAGCTLAGIWALILRRLRIFGAKRGISFTAVWSVVWSRVRALLDGSREAAKEGAVSAAAYWLRILAHGLLQIFCRVIGSLSISYIAPLLAFGAFVSIISISLNMNYALAVEYNGEFMGYIADESVFDQAEEEVQNRIVFEDYIRPENAVAKFSIASVRNMQLKNKDQLADGLILASGNELADATGLYVDGRFVGAVREGKELKSLLDARLADYRSDDSQESAKETVSFVKDVKTREGIYPLTSINSLDDIEAELDKEQTQQKVYTAIQGDAPITIAQKNGIPYSQLKALNPNIEDSLVVGQEVLVQKSVPFLEVQVEKEITYQEPVAFSIEQVQDQSQYQGYVKVTQTGQNGLKEVKAKVTLVDGVETTRDVLDTRVLTDPINERVVVGGKLPLQTLPSITHSKSSGLIWPVDGGYVSCPFGGYSGHTGMDIATNAGVAVRAAAAGTVTKVVYNSYGYGYHLVINHGGGVETLYAHNSKIYVKVGDWVEQGQLIAAVGRTGRATGNHCHFEVHVNGKYVNPANYIGTVYPF
jgi:murein DD-endopeptidase MepM/ murein hydrolase activator NlpD